MKQVSTVPPSIRHRLSKLLDELGEAVGLPLALLDARRDVVVCNEHFDPEHQTLHALYPLDVELPATGALYLAAGQPAADRPPIDWDRVVHVLAGSIGVLVEREASVQRLSRVVHDRSAELNLLYHVFETLGTVFDVEAICGVILDEAIRRLDVTCGAFVLAGSGTDEVEVASQHLEGVAQPEQYAPVMRELARSRLHAAREDTAEGQAHRLNATQPCVEETPLGPVVVALAGTGDQSVGALVLVDVDEGAGFTPENLRLVGALAAYAGIKVRSARLVTAQRQADELHREMTLARDIQRSILPADAPELPGLDVVGYCRPATLVSGDYYRFFPLDGDRWAFAQADVSGHGLGAAFAMASLHSALRSELRFSLSAGHILSTTNDFLYDDARSTSMYATCALGIYEHEAGAHTFHYAVAGHPRPLLWRAADERIERLEVGGLPLGLFKGEPYEDDEVTLYPGDVLVLYTDGLTELRDAEGDMLGEERIHEVIRAHAGCSAAAVVDALVELGEAHRGETAQRDDVTLTVVRVLEEGG